MEKASAFVPGHISGFFQPCVESENLTKRGSRNCGICIDEGVTTTVEVEESPSPETEIFINGGKASAGTTRTALDKVQEEVEDDLSVKVEHSVQAPIGAGYGMSASGALGVILALSEALDLDFEREKILAMAHEAEVVRKSGLGDVGPEMLGGLVSGLEPGAPPYGKWEKIDLGDDFDIVCGTMDSLSTENLLENQKFREEAERLGEIALDDLLSDKSIENFMKVSRDFAIELDVFETEFERVIEEISSESPLGASGVMLGEAIFAPSPVSETDDLKQVFLDYFNPSSVMITSMNSEGCQV